MALPGLGSLFTSRPFSLSFSIRYYKDFLIPNDCGSRLISNTEASSHTERICSESKAVQIERLAKVTLAAGLYSHCEESWPV